MQTAPQPSKNLLKIVRSLDQKKFRDEYGLFVVEGEKCVRALLDAAEWEVPFVMDAIGSFGGHGEQYYAVSDALLQKISFQKTPQGVLAVARIRETDPDVEHLSRKTSLLLDGINDPGNLGTVIRIAAWFGISTVLLTAGSVDPYNPKVVQASMGALFHVDVCRLTYAQVKAIKAPLVGMEMNGESLFDAGIQSPAVYVMGSESHGISDEIKSLLMKSLTIPGSGQIESLNVGVAAGILCAEIFRKSLV